MKFNLGRATLAAVLLAAIPSFAMATDVLTPKSDTIIANGVVVGGPGVKLNCGSVSVEFHNAQGALVAKSNTTAGGGGCAYSTKVPARMALTSCAGLFTRSSIDSPNFAPAGAKMFDAASNREGLGTIGGMHIYSGISQVSADGAGGQIKISSAP
jgi:hypothetical protein